METLQESLTNIIRNRLSFIKSDFGYVYEGIQRNPDSPNYDVTHDASYFFSAKELN